MPPLPPWRTRKGGGRGPALWRAPVACGPCWSCSNAARNWPMAFPKHALIMAAPSAHECIHRPCRCQVHVQAAAMQVLILTLRQAMPSAHACQGSVPLAAHAAQGRPRHPSLVEFPHLAAGDAKYTQAMAMSHLLPMRPRGTRAVSCSWTLPAELGPSFIRPAREGGAGTVRRRAGTDLRPLDVQQAVPVRAVTYQLCPQWVPVLRHSLLCHTPPTPGPSCGSGCPRPTWRRTHGPVGAQRARVCG